MYIKSQVSVINDQVVKTGLGRYEVQAQKDLYPVAPRVYQHNERMLVMELVVGQSFEEKVTAGRAEQLGYIVAWMHSHDWAHSDLKLEHILWTANGIRLIDFGLACPTDKYPVMKTNDLEVLRGSLNSEFYWGVFIKAYGSVS